jgi:hypothetical protein
LKRKQIAARKPTRTEQRLHAAALHSVVMEFQFLEEALRMYIDHAFDVIRARTAGLIPFNRDRRELEGLSLGRLIDEFAKHVDDGALVRELKALVPDRNYGAHRAFMHAVFSWETPDGLPKATERQTAVYEQAHAATGKVIELMQRLGEVAQQAHLDNVEAAEKVLAEALRRQREAAGEPDPTH